MENKSKEKKVIRPTATQRQKPPQPAVHVEGYVVPEGEEGDVHAELEQKRFNPATGERLSKAYIQKFNPRAWLIFRANAALQGYTVRVMYAPPNTPVDIPTGQTVIKV